jgi:chorismate mutase
MPMIKKILHQTPFVIAEVAMTSAQRRRLDTLSERIRVTATVMEIKARAGDWRPAA